jgi:metal-responsive CopG/Arc/MetJ family transcriptional regulator
MAQNLATVSFSVDKKIQEQLDQQAAEEGRSKSDIFREMYRQYRMREVLRRLQEAAQPVLMANDLKTDDDVARFMREN